MRYVIGTPVPPRRFLSLSLVLAVSTCDRQPDPTREDSPAYEASEQLLPTTPDVASDTSTPEAPAPQAAVIASAPTPTPERAPIGIRIARQTIILRDAPEANALVRGRIPLGEAFEVYAYVDGQGCGGKGWGDVGNHAFACLEATRKADDDSPPLRMLPELRDAGLAPFFYAKVKQGDVAHRWRSLRAYAAGEPPVDELEPEHDYAFVTRRRFKGELVLIDEKDRVVLEKDVTRYRPSRFAGRDLQADPVPAGKLLAWGVTWPENPVSTEPRDGAPMAASIDYQAELLLDPVFERNADGLWFRIDEGRWIAAKHLGRWQPATPPADIADDEIWIDIELDDQVLTLSRGPTPLFATLVSTGFKGPTPRGLFRISMKQAIGQMQARPDAEEQYNVEAVPFVQYFSGNFALHGAFWHYRFGHKISHGCVNLSPRDARFLYGQTAPAAKPGWLHVYESPTQPGTTIRIRRGDEPVTDKRQPFGTDPLAPGEPDPRASERP